MLGSTTDSYCYHLSEFQIALIEETTLLDNLLLSLRDYYQSVKTKRQSDYEVPAGFRQHLVHQRDLRQHRKSLFPDHPDLPEPGEIIHPEIREPSTPITNHTKSSSLDIKCPIVRAVDKASSSLPQTISMSEDFLRQCTGFRRLDTMLSCFSNLYQDTVKLDNTPADAVLDVGNYATLRKKKQKHKTSSTFILFW
jgi:hypothetical protein